MGYITLAVLVLTAVGAGFGALFGLIRGRERALLRLALVILSVILALVLRGAVVDTAMTLEIDGESLQETLMEEFSSGEEELPEGVQNLIFALIEILIGFAAYFVLLFSLRFLTWFFLFPFLKLIIRGVEKRRAIKRWREFNETPSESVSENGESVEAPVEVAFVKSTRKQRKKFVKKHRGWGALVGLVQGLLLAYFLLAPITCLVTQADNLLTTLSEVEMDGEPLVEMPEIPEEIGLSEYTNSVICKIYNTTGGWFYGILTSTTDADGNEVSLDKLIDSAVVIVGVANSAMSLEEDFKIFENENATDEEIIEAVHNIGDKIIEIGNSMKEIDENTMNTLTGLIVDFAGEEAPKEELEKFTEILTPETLVQAGNGIKSLATYAEIKNEDKTVTPDDAAEIVDGLNQCLPFIDAIEGIVEEDLSEDLVLEIDDEDKDVFRNAIEGLDGASAENKDALKKIFGLN